MLRFRASKSASAAYHYFKASDSGLDAEELRKEVGGRGAELLGLARTPDFDQFKNLLEGRHPVTGEQLTASLQAGRISYWDITASVPKGVTIALEAGDDRVQDAIWEAGRETMADLERLIMTRVRQGGKMEDRITGNLIWYGFEHPETRPAKEDHMPDPDRHVHFVCMNLTHDPVEGQWKAIKIRQIWELRKYFDRRFDQRVASKMADLGYGIETKFKQGKYYSWDIRGIPDSVTKKFSRRSAEVEKLAKDLGVGTPMGKDKLGATSRLHKRKDLTLDDYREYWSSRLTEREKKELRATLKASLGAKPDLTRGGKLIEAAQYAIKHHFHSRSVVPVTELEITAMERSMGAGKPENVLPVMLGQGLLVKEGEATTKEVLEQEGRIVAFAREGRGTMRPLGIDRPVGSQVRNNQATDSQACPAQQAVIRHVHRSTDQMILIRGAAGTGKTFMLKTALKGVENVAVLAPSVEASRGVLRRDGFEDANTIRAFLNDPKWQAQTRIVVADEMGMASIAEWEGLTEWAKSHDGRLIVLGDDKQHKSPMRHGNMFRVLQDYAHLPVAELTDIRRQKGKYKDASAAFAKGDPVKGVDILDDMGWIKYVETGRVVSAIADKAWDNARKGKPSVISGITHKQNDEITAELRQRLRREKKIGQAEWALERLKPLYWSDAQKMDFAHQYDGTEVVQFFRSVGPFKAGQTVGAKELLAYEEHRTRRHRGPRSKKPGVQPEHFAVYTPVPIGLSKRDTIRATAGGKMKDGTRIDNGDVFTFQGLTKDGDLKVSTNRKEYVIGKGFKHIDHALVRTSQKVQGRTDPTVITALTRQALPAFRAEHGYVDITRGKEEATIVTDLSPEELRAAIKREDTRKSATELMTPKPKARILKFVRKVRETYHRLRDRAEEVIQNKRSKSYGR